MRLNEYGYWAHLQGKTLERISSTRPGLRYVFYELARQPYQTPPTLLQTSALTAQQPEAVQVVYMQHGRTIATFHRRDAEAHWVREREEPS